jgi:dihydrofolate reductase
MSRVLYISLSRTLKTADWANTTIAAGDTAAEVDKLRQGGDGHIVVYGGISLWHSLMRLDQIDYFYLTLPPTWRARAGGCSRTSASTGRSTWLRA